MWKLFSRRYSSVFYHGSLQSSLWNIQTQSKSISVTIIFNEQSCYCCCNSVCERERERCFDLSRNTMPPQLSARWWQVTLTGDLRRAGQSALRLKIFQFYFFKIFSVFFIWTFSESEVFRDKYWRLRLTDNEASSEDWRLETGSQSNSSSQTTTLVERKLPATTRNLF